MSVFDRISFEHGTEIAELLGRAMGIDAPQLVACAAAIVAQNAAEVTPEQIAEVAERWGEAWSHAPQSSTAAVRALQELRTLFRRAVETGWTLDAVAEAFTTVMPHDQLVKLYRFHTAQL